MTIPGVPTTHPRDRIPYYDETRDMPRSTWLPPGQRAVGACRDATTPEWYLAWDRVTPAEREAYWHRELNHQNEEHAPSIPVRSTRLYKILCEGGDSTPEVIRVPVA